MDVMATWEKAIAATDGVEQPEATVTRLKRFFTEAGYLKPLDAVGIVKEDLVNGTEGAKWPTNGAHLAMARRVLKYVNAVQEAHQFQRCKNLSAPGSMATPVKKQPRHDNDVTEKKAKKEKQELIVLSDDEPEIKKKPGMSLPRLFM